MKASRAGHLETVQFLVEKGTYVIGIICLFYESTTNHTTVYICALCSRV